MKKNKKPVDKTKASRDGHEFHENWAARKALQLLWPKNGLIGIAMEGLHPVDQKKAASETVEIADVTLYHGNRPSFKNSDRVIVVQLKYSISHADTPFRNSHAKKTIEKFAKSYLDFKKTYSDYETNKKVKFELVTNRPIYPYLIKAVETISQKGKLTGETKKQADQFIKACGLKGNELIEFAKKVSFTGLAGSLDENKRHLSRVLADWSGAKDHMSRLHLGNIKQLLRDKAGIKEQHNNIIKLVDILDVLEVEFEDLFPCRESFPEVGEVVPRNQLSDAIELISNTDKPFLIHASGGVGKTVFLQSIAKSLGETHEVVLFDCFGGGAYRAPEDARHLPKKAFSHIVNILASKGLCDPLIPTNNNTEDLIKVFRKRLTQAIKALQRISDNKKIILFFDAIDNSADIAREKRQESFAKELLKSIEYSESIPNVTLVLSCRTERRELAKDNLFCHEFKLETFNHEETKAYLQKRKNKLTISEINVAQARSGGNPRVLEHLALSDRGLLDKSEISNLIKLDDLLKMRIDEALKIALKRGYEEDDINVFLSGLSVLPPPVPIEEYAKAQGMDESEVQSFISDLAPLLEKTKQGIWFRDEPTETLVRKKYTSNEVALKKVSENLLIQQSDSVYAARSLPSLLLKINDGDKLFELAFDERFPQKITSKVGKQTIRYSRLKAAISQALYNKNCNQLVQLLVELSTIEAINQKGGDYLLDNPDLIIASQDVDATRRLFELRTTWQGTRHARLAIAYILSNDQNEAYRHGLRANEWINHYYQQENNYKREMRCEAIDVASVPLCILSQNDGERAISWMRRWKAWYAFKISKYLFTFLNQPKLQISTNVIKTDNFLEHLTDEIGVITGALSFYDHTNNHQEILVKKLANACKDKDLIKVKNDNYSNEIKYHFYDGIFKSVAIALSKNLKYESRLILETLQTKVPSLWSFNNNYYRNDITPFIIYKTISAIANSYEISEQDLLPEDLAKIWPEIDRSLHDGEFIKLIKKIISDEVHKTDDESDVSFTYEKKQDANRFLDDKLVTLTQLVQSFHNLLSTTIGSADKNFLHFIKSWSSARKSKAYYDYTNQFNRFFNNLGRELIIFFLWARCDISLSSMTKFWKLLNEENYIEPNYLIEIVLILAKQTKFHELAGEISVKVSSIIEKEDDVETRSLLYSKLSRAILPASIDEATLHFRNGLDQVDVIGSENYLFVEELMSYSAHLNGDELDEKNFHILTNIQELNMGDEPHKRFWDVFTKGLSNTSGIKGFAKLSVCAKPSTAYTSESI